jgi:hypothetical protein
MCEHLTQCPAIDQPGAENAQVIAYHADLGWSILCNGAIVLDSAVRPSPAPVVAVSEQRRAAARKRRVPAARREVTAPRKAAQPIAA